jgi:glycosyltransferase involved in cell wall biosynthesis
MAEHTQAQDGAGHLLSVLMPVYNERYLVEQAIHEVLNAHLPQGVALELVVVDDCSTDGTSDILRRVAAEQPELICLLRHERNRGKGAAIRTAVEHASGTICLIQDADLEYSTSDYPRLLKPILDGNADAVYGSRFLPAEYRHVMFFWHSLGNRLLTLLSNAFTNLNLTDMETCYKVVKASILKSVPIRSNRFGMEPELTAKLAKRGCRIYEVPISYCGRSYAEGKKIKWSDGFKALWTILRFWAVDDLYDELYGHAILHRLSSTQRFNAWMASAIGPWVGESVLETGAGMGNLTDKLIPRQRYLATDLDPLHLEYLRSRYGSQRLMEISKVDLEEPADFQDLQGQFDTVLCLNVLEHIQDHALALRNMFAALEPGGAAIVLVPQGQWLYGTLDAAVDHCRRYSASDLRARCEEAGFVVEHVFSFNRVSLWPWLINGRLLRRKQFGRMQLKIFDSLVWLWRRLDRLLPWPGLSVVGVARKPD